MKNKILGYGEDALTLWALHDKEMLRKLMTGNEEYPPELIFYRPSFGRHGGGKSPQFGEFDFILITKKRVYLGESKWDGSSEITKDQTIQLRPEQLARHRIFKGYLQACFEGGDLGNWKGFSKRVETKLKRAGIAKPVIKDEGSKLVENLQSILGKIPRRGFNARRRIVNVLLYFYEQEKTMNKERRLNIPTKINGQRREFRLVTMPYPREKKFRFIEVGNLLA